MSKIVSATGAGAHTMSASSKPLANMIQNAMEMAIRKAAADGVTDPVKVRERIQQARAAAKKTFFDNANLASAGATQAGKE